MMNGGVSMKTQNNWLPEEEALLKQISANSKMAEITTEVNRLQVNISRDTIRSEPCVRIQVWRMGLPFQKSKKPVEKKPKGVKKRNVPKRIMVTKWLLAKPKTVEWLEGERDRLAPACIETNSSGKKAVFKIRMPKVA